MTRARKPRWAGAKVKLDQAVVEAATEIFYAWCEEQGILDDYPPSEAQVGRLLVATCSRVVPL